MTQHCIFEKSRIDMCPKVTIFFYFWTHIHRRNADFITFSKKLLPVNFAPFWKQKQPFTLTPT
jgi:hypothetical protein